MRAYATLVAALALACGASVQAASLTDFNVIVKGNMSLAGGDSTGTVAVGGNFSTTNPWDFNGNVQVGGTVTGTYHLNNGSTLTHTALDTNYASLMSSVSDYFKNQVADSFINTSGNPTFVATPGADNLAVFSVGGSIFSNQAYQNGWNFSGLSNDVTVVINVSGSTINFTKGNFNNTNYDRNIIWNFYEATSIDLSNMGGQFQGTILAPNAALTISNRQINGNVYVDSFTSTGAIETHYYPYEGYLPTGSPPPVPEPATLGLLLPVMAGMLLRRTKH